MISVIIPLFNKAAHILATLESIAAQTYKDYEVIVVNDGSTDDGDEQAREWMIAHPKFRMIDQSNSGVSAARNAGIRAATGEWVALIDADDIWDEGCLEALSGMIDEYPEAVLNGVNYAYVENGKTVPCPQGLPEGFCGYIEDYFHTLHGDLFCSSSVVIRRDIALSNGLFDERIRIAEDLDVWYRIILTHRVAFYNKVFAYYYKDATNRAEANPNAHFEITHRMDYYIDKYVPYYTTHPDFARFIGMRVAYNILHGGYYFGTPYDRECTDHIVKFLSYQDLPAKYRFIFKTPRPVGWCIYQFSLLKKRIFK